jgi:hypothetical protein
MKGRTMDVRSFHTARRCSSALLPIRDDHFALLLQFRIELIRFEPTSHYNVNGTHCSGNGILHDNVDGTHFNFQLDPWTDTEWANFRSNFVRVIRDYWDGAFRLVPSEPWYTRASGQVAATIDCNLSIELVANRAAAHHRYYICKPRRTASGHGFRSFADPINRVALLTHQDLGHERFRERVLVGGVRHNVDFQQCVALHEFGHTLGLGHVNGSSNSTAAYGVTLEQFRQIMGGGDWMTTRWASPWVSRLDRHLVRRPGRAEADVRFAPQRTGLQLITYWDNDWRPPPPSAARPSTAGAAHPHSGHH